MLPIPVFARLKALYCFILKIKITKNTTFYIQFLNK